MQIVKDIDVTDRTGNQPKGQSAVLSTHSPSNDAAVFSNPGSDVPGLAPKAATALWLSLLGNFTIQINGVPLRRLRTRQGYRLLALLILQRGIPVERTFLAATLWPEFSRSDHTAPHALAHLHRCLTDLQHALGPAACRLHTFHPRLLQFDLLPIDHLDIEASETSATPRIPSPSDDLDRATALYSGPLWEGHGDEWTAHERSRFGNFSADLSRHDRNRQQRRRR